MDETIPCKIEEVGATIVVAYLMKKHGVTRDQALLQVKAVRPFVAPNPGFMKQLANFEKALKVQGYILLFPPIRKNPKNPNDTGRIFFGSNSPATDIGDDDSDDLFRLRRCAVFFVCRLLSFSDSCCV
ncbi:hypothetical protein Droror1_Dr00007799 [Drosera rotundifolia]